MSKLEGVVTVQGRYVYLSITVDHHTALSPTALTRKESRRIRRALKKAERELRARKKDLKVARHVVAGDDECTCSNCQYD